MKNLNKNNDINNIKMKKHSFITAQLVVWLLVMLCCFAVGVQISYSKNSLNDSKNIAPVSASYNYEFDNFYFLSQNKIEYDDNQKPVAQISTFKDLLYVYLNYYTLELNNVTQNYAVQTALHRYKLCSDIEIPHSDTVLTASMTIYNSYDDYEAGTVYTTTTYDFYLWSGIGSAVPFDGEFDGNYHTITFNDASAGLFYQASDLTVKNLGIKGTINNRGNVGGICGIVNNSLSITNCYNSATITADDYNDPAGGLVGCVNISNNSFSLTIENCYNVGRVSDNDNSNEYGCGGLVGRLGDDSIAENITVSIKNCYNAGWIAESDVVRYGLRPLCGVGDFSGDEYEVAAQLVSGLYFLSGCSAIVDSECYVYSPTAKTPSELKTIFSNTTGWTQSPSVNGGYPYLTGFAAPTTKWLTLNLGTGYTINEVSGEYAIGMDAGQTIDLSTLNISPAITSANLSKASGGGTLSGTTYTFGSTDGVVNVSAATYSVTIAVNNSGYGSVSNSSVTVEYGTSITSNSNVLTIGSTKITATPKSSDGQYSYKFSSWTGIPSGKQVVGNVTITANFTRTEESHSLTIVLKSNTEREYIVYILGSNGNPTRQLVMKNGNSYTITGLKQGEKFSILVAETLYTICTIKDTTVTEQTRKKTYENGLSANTNIEISISGAGNVNNWIVI